VQEFKTVAVGSSGSLSQSYSNALAQQQQQAFPAGGVVATSRSTRVTNAMAATPSFRAGYATASVSPASTAAPGAAAAGTARVFYPQSSGAGTGAGGTGSGSVTVPGAILSSSNLKQLMMVGTSASSIPDLPDASPGNGSGSGSGGTGSAMGWNAPGGATTQTLASGRSGGTGPTASARPLPPTPVKSQANALSLTGPSRRLPPGGQ
jgi:hypothetical protein